MLFSPSVVNVGAFKINAMDRGITDARTLSADRLFSLDEIEPGFW